MSRVKAIFVADLHFSHKAPIFRSVEEDWYKTQKGYLKQLQQIAREHKAPIICAGDVFDRWNSPVQLVNMLIEHMPEMYAVPGQHDLPNHNYDGLPKSAYWTLVKAGKIHHIPKGDSLEVGDLRLHGFPYGADIVPLQEPNDLLTEIAVIHSYIWVDNVKETAFTGAPLDKVVSSYRKKLKGYDAAVFGDNHIPFQLRANNDYPTIWNCGGFMRRKADERKHNPRVGLLLSEGTVKEQRLDTSKDKIIDRDHLLKSINGIGAETFIEALTELCDQSVDFVGTIHRLLERDKVSTEVKDIIHRILESV